MSMRKLEPKVRAFLEEPRYAVLATLYPNGAPHLTEIWYELRGDDIIFNTTEERTKKRNLEADPRASLLVAGRMWEPTWARPWYVRVDGTVRRIATGKEALDDIVALSVRYDGPQSEEEARASFARMHRVTYAMTIERVYPKGLSSAVT
jgi:PPOX class probable F420-dependent enzyme